MLQMSKKTKSDSPASKEKKERKAIRRPYFLVWVVIIELSFSGRSTLDTSSAFGCGVLLLMLQQSEERFAVGSGWLQ